MSTKPFKDIEQMMKDRAVGFEQPFEEDSWRKMEVLLDRDKNRKRPAAWLWWLLPVLLVGVTGTYVYFSESGTSENKVTGDQQLLVKNTGPTIDIGIHPLEQPKNLLNEKAGGKNNPQITVVAKSRSAWHQTGPMLTLGNSTTPTYKNQPYPATSNELSHTSKKSNIGDAIPSRALVSISPGEMSAERETATPNQVSKAAEPASPDAQKMTAPGNKPRTNDAFDTAKSNSSRKSNPNNVNESRWYFMVATGIESSGTKLFEVGEINATAVLNLGYQLTNSLSIQTGIHVGRKKYIAGPADYKAKAGTYWSTVNISKVKANCLVYEIPLNVRYDFRPAKALKLFASTGLSSYLMKKEDYEYTYNRNGYAHTAAAAYTGNRHLLSVARVAAGIEKSIGKNLSLHASPAVSIPLSGVGEGSMKLYSTELTLGFRYSPAKKQRFQ